MMMISTTMLIILVISMITMSLSMILSKKSFTDREKLSPFECGFDPKSSARLPFSLHFFLIAVIFLIFDVEITLLLPFIMLMKMTNPITLSILMSSFMFILLAGLYHEWTQGALNWTV
uniref:NADH-ubiquinone oxidoreductase chain 3 n=1 Tax=Lycostomus sp. YXY-2021 TaxID=2806917 RepID=A0A888YLQ2_9COLE|nr:NADH dehydrogenase subunit 3 [Lycostomus sp. YXY-2021]